MKKLVFLFFIVLVSGLAMGQNTSTTTQLGDNQQADVSQVGSSTSIITQSTDDDYAQKAVVDQNGASNMANINQIETDIGTNQSIFAAFSTVTQTGDENNADIDVFETGGGNKGNLVTSLIQIGNQNSGTQSLNAPGSNSGHNVTAKQVGNNNNSTQITNGGYTLSYQVDQYGSTNNASQTGHGDRYTDARIKQSGERNSGTQDIFGSNNGYSAAVVLIDQFGAGNVATQSFTGTGWSHRNNGEIWQDGTSNNASQIANGRSLDLQINQTGELNEATQNVTGNNYDLGIGLISATQLGDENEATQTANGDGIVGTIAQTGNYNVATMLQTGNLHSATITQTGNTNTATITQN
nr:hypothetical protein [uncultured Draconibacterium sp.]